MKSSKVLAIAAFAASIGLALPSSMDSQVPAEDGPPYNLSTTEDLGALRVTLESIRAQWKSLSGLREVSDLRFSAVLQSNGIRIYSGSYLLEQAMPVFLASTQSSNFVLRHPRSVVYLHEVGQPCAIPPDSLFDSPRSDKRSFDSELNRLRSDSEIEFLIHVLGIIEQGDPSGILGPLATYSASGSTLSLGSFCSRKTAEFHSITLHYNDSANQQSVSHTITGQWTSAGFTQVDLSGI